MLYWRYVLKKRSLEKLTFIFEFNEKKFALEKGAGKSKSFIWEPKEIFKKGGNLYVNVPPKVLIFPLKNWPILSTNLISYLK